MYKTVEIQRSTVSTCSLTLLAYKIDRKGSSYEWDVLHLESRLTLTINIDNVNIVACTAVFATFSLLKATSLLQRVICVQNRPLRYFKCLSQQRL